MSLLTKTEATINQLEQRNQTFVRQVKQIETLSEIEVQQNHAQDIKQAAGSYTIELNELNRQVDKFLSKANETDPDQQIYGPSAIKRIQTIAATFKQHYQDWQPIYNQIQTLCQSVNMLKAESDQRIAHEKAEQLRLAEIEHARVEQVRLEAEAKRAQAIEQARLEAETRAREEKDAQLLAAAQAAEKAQQEAEATKAASDRAAAEEKERQEKAQADKLAAAEAEAKKKSEERARRPPLQKAREDLIDALDMLYESCVSSDYTVAIQMLFKFVHQITANPLDAKLRTLHTNNSVMKQRLLAKKGGAEALHAIGFTKSEGVENDEISIQPNADAWNQLVQAKSLIEHELEAVRAGRRVNKPSTDIQTISTSSLTPASAPRPSPPVPATSSPQQPNANPFASLFNNPAFASNNPFVPGNFDYSQFLGALRSPPTPSNPLAQSPLARASVPNSPFPFPFTFPFQPQPSSNPPPSQFPSFNPLTMMQNPEFMRAFQSGGLAQAMQGMTPQVVNNTTPTPIPSSTVPTMSTTTSTSSTSATTTVTETECELTEEELLEQALAMSVDEDDDKKPSH